MATLYIGHSRQDTTRAEQIAAFLAGQGHNARLSSQVATGSNWREAAENAIRAADAYVYLHSPQANATAWLQNELLTAANQKKPIIPIIVAPADIPKSLLNFQFIDATSDFESALQRASLAVDAVTSFPSQPPVATTREGADVKRSVPPPASAVPPPQPAPAAAPLYPPQTSTRRMRPWLVIAIIILIIVIPLLLGILLVSQQAGRPQNTPPNATPTALPTETAQPSATFTAQDAPTAPTISEEDAIQVAVAATVSVMRATEEHTLSERELALVAPITAAISKLDNTPLILAVLIAVISLAASCGALFITLRGSARQTPPRRAHSPHHGHNNTQQASSPTPLLADFQVFLSSSERDREWVQRFIEDLQLMGYLIWWYAKDAPGLPFGNEIRSAIYHTKIFMIVMSPDSMKSKHVEEEIRWAEIYDRPIVPILYRAVLVEERLYGLAKGADIDFTNDAFYRESLDLLAQAIDHYLQQRLEALPTPR